MFNNIKRKVIKEAIDELVDLREKQDSIVQSEREVGTLNSFELGVGLGIRKSLSKMHEMYVKYM